jgi:hypothetical protein
MLAIGLGRLASDADAEQRRAYHDRALRPPD